MPRKAGLQELQRPHSPSSCSTHRPWTRLSSNCPGISWSIIRQEICLSEQRCSCCRPLPPQCERGTFPLSPGSSPAAERARDAYSGSFQTTTHLQEPNFHHICFSSSCFLGPAGWAGLVFEPPGPQMCHGMTQKRQYFPLERTCVCAIASSSQSRLFQGLGEKKSTDESRGGKKCLGAAVRGDDLGLTGLTTMQKWS